MSSITKFNKNQSGQAALEAAIILIAFVVVASVFAFAVLSAGTSSTARGEQSIYNGLKEVQSSMSIKGAVIGKGTSGASGTLDSVIFTVALVSGGDPVSLASITAPGASATQSADPSVVISYRDGTNVDSALGYAVRWIVGNGDSLLENGELAEITVTLNTSHKPKANTPFTLEVKPPTGAVLDISRTTPAAIETVMTLR
jgi:flagellin FlaB